MADYALRQRKLKPQYFRLPTMTSSFQGWRERLWFGWRRSKEYAKVSGCFPTMRKTR